MPAFSVLASGSDGTDVAAGGAYTGTTWTPVIGATYIIFIYVRQTAANVEDLIMAVTDSGDSIQGNSDKIVQQNSFSNTGSLAAFWYVPLSAATQKVVCFKTGNFFTFDAPHTAWMWAVVRVDGITNYDVDPNTTRRSISAAMLAGATTITATLSGGASSMFDGYIGAMAHQVAEDVVPTAPASELVEVSVTTPVNRMSVASIPNPTSGPTAMTWTWTTSNAQGTAIFIQLKRSEFGSCASA